jgi:aminoglycoside 3-N-acetyltransferase
MPSLTADSIATDLSNAGLASGDSLVMHSSLSSLGHVDGGADAVIGAILQVIGPDGTLMTPTFNHWVVDVFDPGSTPGLSGLITERLRQYPTAVRSLHPTHSVAAVGKRAREFLRGHEEVGALRRDSPLDRLAKAGGYTLLVGVKHDRNSMIHVGEAWAEPWYLGFPFTSNDPSHAKILVDREVRTMPLTRQPGCSIAFNALELPLRSQHQIRDLRIGGTPCQVIRAQDVIDQTIGLLRQSADLLLCTNPSCFFCSNARANRPGA